MFGRNPELLGDLLNEPLHVVPATTGLTEDHVARAQAIRSTARQAVITLQDDRAIRHALAARPSAVIDFEAGDLVAYWRQQKLNQGTVVQGGRWHGTAVVIGKIGKNYIIAHRKQIFRCAPEQLRPATTEERTLVTTPQTELLGICDMIEGGTFRGKQYVDLISGQYPSVEAPPEAVTGSPDAEAVPSNPPSTVHEPPASVPTSDPMAPSNESRLANIEEENPQVEHDENPQRSLPVESLSSYEPIRRRVAGKSGEAALHRPAALRQDDFIEIMREVVPELLQNALGQSSASSSSNDASMNK